MVTNTTRMVEETLPAEVSFGIVKSLHSDVVNAELLRIALGIAFGFATYKKRDLS